MITSVQNGKIKEAAALLDRRDRKKRGEFLIEGYRELRRAVDAGWEIERLFFCRELFLGENEDGLLEDAGGERLECSRQVFEKLSYRDRPDGLIAVAPMRHRGLESLKTSKNRLLVVAERIEKPGNLGTILRSADAAGADGVIVADPTTDIFNPNVVRSSVGTLFTMPVIEVDGERALLFLKEEGIALVAATPHAEIEFTKADLKGSVAIAVGTEQLGLSEPFLEAAKLKVKIPMFGVADSLNVASATTLLLYEAVRQRRL